MSYVAVLVAAVVQMILGFLWYGPLFGKTWMSLMGMNTQSMSREGMGRMYTWTFIGSLVTAGVLRKLATMVGAVTIGAGAMLGGLVWLGFVATVTLASVIYEKRPVKLYVLNNGYQIVSLVIIGALLAAWR